jgi:hypothetical protein
VQQGQRKRVPNALDDHVDVSFHCVQLFVDVRQMTVGVGSAQVNEGRQVRHLFGNLKHIEGTDDIAVEIRANWKWTEMHKWKGSLLINQTSRDD